MAARVLVVEDNSDMRRVLSSFLTDNGFRVVDVNSTEAGIDAIDEQDFDIGLIDINLPGKSGFSMIEYIREASNNMPLIAMTARDGLNDKLTGFEMGLTDYLTKPFELKELLARMQVHLRTAGATNLSAQVDTANYHLNPETWEFFIGDRPKVLTNIEFRLMHILMLNNRLVVHADDIVEFVWGETLDALNPPIRIHIANLRRKLGDVNFSIIKTVPAIGYKLNDPPDTGL